MFNRLFMDQQGGGTDAFDDAITAFNHRNPTDQNNSKDSVDPSGCTMTYEGVFFVLAQELVELLALRFGDLGCHQLEVSRSRYLVRCLTYDNTTSMFDAVAECASPLLEYDNHRIVQMIEVWFSQHPLSFTISKTLLLRSLRNNTHDEILLAVIIADVKCAQEDEQARIEGEEMFKWASSRLRDRSKESIALSMVQALILLGWHELCTSRARRAMCYIGWAGCVIPDLQPPKLGVTQINGIDVAAVELETTCNVHWLVFAVTLWAMMQLDSPVSKLDAPTRFPPVDESASAVFKLDMMSDNLSTLPNQARMFRELWPLSHIASTTAHIYALYPQKQDTDESSQHSCWQSRTLRQLRHLSGLGQDISVLCDKIRHVLMNALELVETHVEDSLSQALVLSAYHTMVIHFLFPRLEDGSGSPAVTNTLIDDFCASAEALLQVLSVLNQTPENGRVVMGLRPSSIADVFALGLDACGRAMNCLYSRCRTGSETAKRGLSERSVDLLKLATELHAFSKHSKLLQTTRSRTVKKQLKYAIRSFEILSLEYVPSGNHSASISVASDPFLELPHSNTASMYKPYLPAPLHEVFKDEGVFSLFGASDGNGLEQFPSSGNAFKPTKHQAFSVSSASSASSGRETRPFDHAFLDEMQLDEASGGSGHFDFGFGSAPMDFSSTASGNREGAEFGGLMMNEFTGMQNIRTNLG